MRVGKISLETFSPKQVHCYKLLYLWTSWQDIIFSDGFSPNIIKVLTYLSLLWTATKPSNPCVPNPCGPLSQCRLSRSRTPICACLPGSLGASPFCRPGCTMKSDCPVTETCYLNKCVDPCQSIACAVNARCQVFLHEAVCHCKPGYSGDPLKRCLKPDSKQHCSFSFYCL